MIVKKPAPLRFMLVRFDDLERSAWYLFEVVEKGYVRITHYSKTDPCVNITVEVSREEARECWRFLTAEAKQRWTLWE